MIRFTVGCLAGIVLGLLGGHALVLARAPVAAAPPPVVQRCAVALDGGDLDRMARAVARELDARAPAAAKEPTEAPAQPEPAAVLADHDALDRAQGTIDRAVASGAWTDEDRVALHRDLALVPDADRRTALLAFVRAVNDGKLRVLARPPL